jgi:hypothetical protein
MDGVWLRATATSVIVADSLATENMSTGDSVGSPFTVVLFVANVATRIRVYNKHV